MHTPARIGKRNAYHLAGTIAAIHFGNAEKKLPPVHFQVEIRVAKPGARYTRHNTNFATKYTAALEGGRLIPNLPNCFGNATQLLTDAEKQLCRCAFEADVVNLLCGPLAEAKFVALRDGEVFNANLMYLGALKFYGGALDLLTVEEYFDCLYPLQDAERKQKLAELFLSAYGFINNVDNWKVIASLAEDLGDCTEGIVSCEELIAFMRQNHALAANHCCTPFTEGLSGLGGAEITW